MPDATNIQATISGFKGEPATLFGSVDTAAGVVVVLKEKRPAIETRVPGFCVVTNNPGAAERDGLLSDDRINDAILAYLDFNGRQRLRIAKDIGKFNPEHGIEYDGLDERGRRYRINPEMTNGSVAVLAICWFASQQIRIERGGTAADELMSVYEAFTV